MAQSLKRSKADADQAMQQISDDISILNCSPRQPQPERKDLLNSFSYQMGGSSFNLAPPPKRHAHSESLQISLNKMQNKTMKMLQSLEKIESELENTTTASHMRCASCSYMDIIENQISELVESQTNLIEWMTKNLNYEQPKNMPAARVSKMFNGRDLYGLSGDLPSRYGRNIARIIWTKQELINGIISPGKDLSNMSHQRIPMSPTRKAIFRECVEYKFGGATNENYIKARKSVNQLGTELKKKQRRQSTVATN